MVTLSALERHSEVLPVEEVRPVRSQKSMLAVILDGGDGVRMGGLCDERPVPALPFAGRNRVIDFSLSNCIHSGINSVVVLLDERHSELYDYLKRWNAANCMSGSFRLVESPGGIYASTADAVYQNLSYVEGFGVNSILLLPSHQVYKMDYRKILSFHEYVRADMTMAVVHVPTRQTYRFGNVTVDANSRVRNYVDRPGTARSGLMAIGVYLFNREVLVNRLIRDAAKPGNLHDFGRTIIPSMLTQGDRVFAYTADNYWQDISTAGAYHLAHMELTRSLPSFSLEGRWPILTEPIDLPPMSKSDQGTIKNSIVSRGCVIKGRVENSVLSPGVYVDSEAVVRNSVLMADTFIGGRSLVEHCILDEGVRVGEFCYIGFGPPRVPLRDEVTVLGKGAIIPPHTAIGCNCRILPHVRPSDFASSAIRSGETVEPQKVAVT